MTNTDFNLAAALETLRTTDHPALDKLLLESAVVGNFAVVEVLLKAGAALDATNGLGRTALHLAARNGHTAVAGQLFDKGGAIIDAKDRAGSSPLHLAARYGHSGVAERLITKGAAIGAKDRDGWTPLHCAVFGGHSGTVELLIAKGAAIGAKDNLGRTPQDLAAEYGAEQQRQARMPPPIDSIRAALRALQQG
jgi:ankyrin repeat protein